MSFGLETIAAVGSLIGTGVSALGAMSQGRAAADQARYQAAVAQNNATIAQQNADYARAAGEVKATDQAMRERATARSHIAALAASGMDVNSGSAADIRESDAKVGMLNVERVLSNAELQAYGYRTQATNFEAEAGLDTAAAKNASSAGFLAAGAGLLSGVGSVGGKWAALTKTTTTPSTPTISSQSDGTY